jgi:hypothetical protein
VTGIPHDQIQPPPWIQLLHRLSTCTRVIPAGQGYHRHKAFYRPSQYCRRRYIFEAL